MPKGDYQRLKADIEDGIVPIAHLLLEALSMAKLNGVAKGLVLFIWRRTYGWSEDGKRKYKDDRITLAEFAQAVDSERTYVSTQLKQLVRAGVIFERQDPENGRYKRYGMNTDIAAWSNDVIDVDKLAEAVHQKVYVNSSKQGSKVEQTHNGLADAKGFVDTKPLCENTTKPLCKSKTFAPKKPASELEIPAPQIKEEIKIIAADDDDDDQARAKSPDEMTVKEFEDEVEFRMRRHMMRPSYQLVRDDYKVLRQMLADGVDRTFILDGIDEAFETFLPKHRFDKINSFTYCAYRIYDRWQAQETKQQVATARAPTTVVESRITARGGRKHATNRASPSEDAEWDELERRFFGS
ncbi:MAG: replication protein [Alicyclobacillus sp.]|nr:replication protein [Alicyclobacillus sp.]